MSEYHWSFVLTLRTLVLGNFKVNHLSLWDRCLSSRCWRRSFDFHPHSWLLRIVRLNNYHQVIHSYPSFWAYFLARIWICWRNLIMSGLVSLAGTSVDVRLHWERLVAYPLLMFFEWFWARFISADRNQFQQACLNAFHCLYAYHQNTHSLKYLTFSILR